MIAEEERRLDEDTGIGATVRQGKRPLEGVPVSLKDTISVAGYDSCMGYSGLLGKNKTADAPLVRLLRDAGEGHNEVVLSNGRAQNNANTITGAIPFVKTNAPITLLSFESANDV